MCGLTQNVKPPVGVSQGRPAGGGLDARAEFHMCRPKGRPVRMGLPGLWQSKLFPDVDILLLEIARRKTSSEPQIRAGG